MFISFYSGVCVYAVYRLMYNDNKDDKRGLLFHARKRENKY